MWSTGAWAWGESTSYVLNQSSEQKLNTIQTGSSMALSGPGATLTFDAKGSSSLTGAGVKYFHVEKSTDGGNNWSRIASNVGLSTSYQTFTYTNIGTDVTHIRFLTTTGSTYTKYYKNVKITRVTTLTTSTSSLAFGDVNKGSSKDLNASISYNNTTYNHQVTGVCKDGSGNTLSDFTVTAVTTGETGTMNVKVTFSPTRVGAQSGTCTLTSTNGKTVSFPVSGTGLPVFKFSATANKIYNHGTATATVANSEIVGSVSDTQKSTTATFTATTNNSTFEGWYSDAGHTTLVSRDNPYTPTITNTSEATTKNLTLYAYFKANQTLTWTQDPYDPNVVAGITYTGLATATASSGLAVAYTSSDTNVATVNGNGDVSGIAASMDPITITARQAGNDEYNAVEATRQFTVINKFQPTFDVSGFQSSSGDNYTSYVDDTPTITVANTTSGFTYNSSDPTVVSISKSGNVITLTALKVGNSTVTLNDPGNTTHYSASKTYNITVVKVPNTLAASLASLTANPDGTIAVTFTGKNNAGTAIVGIITNQVLSSSVNNGSDVITYTNGIITAKNAGTAKITFTQAATDKYAPWTSSTYDIMVTKLSNPISITLAGGSATNIKLKYGATASLSYTYANTTGAAPMVTRASGSYTTYSAGTITAGNAQGTDIYEIRQAETYKYEAGLATFTIRVNNSDEAVGYVLYDESEYSHGTGSGVMHQYTLSGPGETLTYKACRGSAITIYYNLYVERSSDGNNWTEIQNNTSLDADYKSNDFSCEIGDEAARYVRFRFPAGGTLVKYMKDAKVTRKTYVRESHDTTQDNLGTVYTGSTATSSTITVSYSSTNGGNINISSNNQHFVPSISEIAVESNKKATSPGGTEYICGVDGTRTFTVTYTPDPNSLGEETATITIGDLFYSQTITLTATAAKRVNTLAVVGEQTLMVDDVVSDVFSGKNSEATLTATWSRDGVATFDAVNNRITAVGEGTATLTLTQAENDYHYGVTKTVRVNVSKYDQVVAWVNDLDAAARTLEVGDVLTTNTATATSGLAVTYSSSNPSVLEVNATTGALTARAGGANIAITATQAGNYKYNEASITRYFTVIQKEEVVVTTTLLESGTNVFPIGNPDITIRTNARITTDALTISDNQVVSATFGSNTFTLTALKEGTVTVTLTREETEDYYALNKTYTIRVVKPVLVLDPTVAPIINYSEYSTVTLNRTLPAGYSTIALPFDTSVEEIVGSGYDEDLDWVAQLQTVTYSQADGYTLYFNIVDDGIITANQPYVLHLQTAVATPSWTNVDVEEALAASPIHPQTGYSGYAGWSMASNYTVNFPMDGKYGVVNAQGGLMLGSGENAKLNAFSAYITAPSGSNNAPRLRVAYVAPDGKATVVEGLSFDNDNDILPVAIYGPDGRHRSQMQRGLNIVRQCDGSVRKVQR